MTILKSLKQLTPLSARRFLKARLPARLVRLVVGSPTAPSGTTSSVLKASAAEGRPLLQGPVCPICGDALASAQSQKYICTGCGSSPHHRRLALAIYANAQEPTTYVLVLDPSHKLKAIFDGMGGIFSADRLEQAPPELQGRVDLCVHENWPHASSLGPERTLREIDSWLSSRGIQIFTADVSAKGWRINETALLRWLRRKGWPSASVFEPEAVYGANARESFGWGRKGSDDVIILPKKATT